MNRLFARVFPPPPTKRLPTIALIVAGVFLCIPPATVFASTTDGTINNSYRYAWSENAGWIDFGSSAGNVHVTDTALTGSAYGENIGWITLNPPAQGGVTNNAEGALSGYAWSENAGWIDFSKVTIGSNGVFAGNAYSENIGWITFGTGNNKVLTDWRPASTRTPAPAPAPAPAPSPAPSSSGGGTSNDNSIYRTSVSDTLLSLKILANPSVLSATGGTVTYTYTVSNTGNEAVAAVFVQDSVCGLAKYISGNTNENAFLESNEVWTFRCTTNLSRTTQNSATVNGYTSSGVTVRTTAEATVVVGGAQTVSVTSVVTNNSTVTSSGLSNTQVTAILSLLTSFGADASVIANVQMALVGTGAWTSGAIATGPTVFTRDLKLGATGADVKQLQQFLNTHGFIIATAGAGSPGGETSMFGSATQKALIRFQMANGITPAVGYFGPKTRDYIRNLTP